MLSQISETLRTAAISEEGRELLATGRFTAPLTSEGFDVFGGALPGRPKKKASAAKSRQANDELRLARERVRELERAVGEAERRAGKLKAELKESERATESARVALAAAERDLKNAQRRAR